MGAEVRPSPLLSSSVGATGLMMLLSTRRKWAAWLTVTLLSSPALAQQELPTCEHVSLKSVGHSLCLHLNYKIGKDTCREARLEMQPCRAGNPSQIFSLQRIVAEKREETQEQLKLYHPGSHCYVAVPRGVHPLERSRTTGKLADLVQEGHGWLTKVSKKVPYWRFEVAGTGHPETVDCGSGKTAKLCWQCPSESGGCSGDCTRSAPKAPDEGEGQCVLKTEPLVDNTSVSCGIGRRANCSECPKDICETDCMWNTGGQCAQKSPEELLRRNDHMCLVAARPKRRQSENPWEDMGWEPMMPYAEWWTCSESWLRFDPFKLWTIQCAEDTEKVLKPDGQQTAPLLPIPKQEKMEALSKLPDVVVTLLKDQLNDLAGGKGEFEGAAVRICLFFFEHDLYMYSSVIALLEAAAHPLLTDKGVRIGAYICGAPNWPSERVQHCNAYKVSKQMTLGFFGAKNYRSFWPVEGSSGKLLRMVIKKVKEAARNAPMAVVEAQLGEMAAASDRKLVMPVMVGPGTLDSSDFQTGRWLVAFMARRQGAEGSDVAKAVLKILPKMFAHLEDIGFQVGFANCKKGSVAHLTSDDVGSDGADAVDCARESVSYLPDIRIYEAGQGAGEGSSALSAPLTNAEGTKTTLESLLQTMLKDSGHDGGSDDREEL